MDVFESRSHTVSPIDPLIRMHFAQLVNQLLTRHFGPPVGLVVVGLRKGLPHPQSSAQSFKPGTHKMASLITRNHVRDSKDLPLVLQHFFATRAPVSPFRSQRTATIHPLCLSTHTTNASYFFLRRVVRGIKKMSIATLDIILGGMGVCTNGRFRFNGL
jgi:hypothetical protein